MSTTQGIKLDETTHKRLKALGEIRHRTPHWLMRTAIEDYLAREEAYEREKHEDMERWEHYQLTAKAVPQRVVTEWLSNLAQGKAAPCPK